MRIRKGDNVIVLTGSDKNKTGRVLFVDKKKSTVTVEGVNMRKKHQRPTQTNRQGGIISIEGPIHVSNVALHESIEGKDRPTRLSTKVIEEGGRRKRVRVSRRTGEEV